MSEEKRVVVSVKGATKRQAMARLMVARPELLRGAYGEYVADCAARGEEPGSFGAWEDYWWGVAR